MNNNNLKKWFECGIEQKKDYMLILESDLMCFFGKRPDIYPIYCIEDRLYKLKNKIKIENECKIVAIYDLEYGYDAQVLLVYYGHIDHIVNNKIRTTVFANKELDNPKLMLFDKTELPKHLLKKGNWFKITKYYRREKTKVIFTEIIKMIKNEKVANN